MTNSLCKLPHTVKINIYCIHSYSYGWSSRFQELIVCSLIWKLWKQNAVNRSIILLENPISRLIKLYETYIMKLSQHEQLIDIIVTMDVHWPVIRSTSPCVSGYVPYNLWQTLVLYENCTAGWLCRPDRNLLIVWWTFFFLLTSRNWYNLFRNLG